jgi:hypothetical protein
MSAQQTVPTTHATGHDLSAVLIWVARVAGAGFLAWMAVDHLYLYHHYGYSHVPKLDWLFIVNGVGGIVMALAVLGSPRRLLPLVALGGAALLAGTLLGLILAINVNGGIWGITESSKAPLVHQVVTVEILGTIILAALAVVTLNRKHARSVSGG